MNQTVINQILPQLLHDLAATTNCRLINVFDAMGTALLTHSDWFVDGCHPTTPFGYQIHGEVVYSQIRWSLQDTKQRRF